MFIGLATQDYTIVVRMPTHHSLDLKYPYLCEIALPQNLFLKLFLHPYKYFHMQVLRLALVPHDTCGGARSTNVFCEIYFHELVILVYLQNFIALEKVPYSIFIYSNCEIIVTLLLTY